MSYLNDYKYGHDYYPEYSTSSWTYNPAMHNTRHHTLPQHWVEEFKSLPDEWLNYFAPGFLKAYDDAEKIIKEVAEKFEVAEQLLVTLIHFGRNPIDTDKYTDEDILYPCNLIEEGLYNQLSSIAMLFKYYYNDIFTSDAEYEEFDALRASLAKSNMFYPKNHERDSYNFDTLSYYDSESGVYVYFENPLSLNFFRHMVPLYSNHFVKNYVNYFSINSVLLKCTNVKKQLWFPNYAESRKDSQGFYFYSKMLQMENGLMPFEYKDLNFHIELASGIKVPIIETINDSGDCVYFKNNFLMYREDVIKRLKDDCYNYYKYELGEDI